MKSQKSLRRAVVLMIFMVSVLPMSPFRAMAREVSTDPATLKRLVQEAHAEFKDVKEGKPADYIPELAKVPPDLFGVVIVTAEGEIYTAGDVDHPFTIQSVSKPFTAALVMQEQGDEAIEEKIGVEPTGQKFNSILATQIIKDISANPLVNSGAIAAVSMVRAKSAGERFNKILKFDERLAGTKLNVIEEVYKSEAATNQRNRAHAYILEAEERIYSDPIEAVDVYTRQCSIGVTAKQLAVMGATLANNGVNPITQEKVLDPNHVPKVLALMMMAGFYDESGEWAYTAGLPAKTGVGGGNRRGGAWENGDRRFLAARERRGQQRPFRQGDRVHRSASRRECIRRLIITRSRSSRSMMEQFD
ncbi:MAG: glutaminase A [Candidatus Manganitrophus sp.]|nr:MAG: glutaminase A [Candidatus Manganitrophus sp.]